MTQDKMRRVITAIVSACTVLLTLLSAFLVYQWITIAILNKKIKAEQDKIEYWTSKNETDQDLLDHLESDLYKEWALQNLQALEGKNK